jgi:hypothetical protein
MSVRRSGVHSGKPALLEKLDQKVDGETAKVKAGARAEVKKAEGFLAKGKAAAPAEKDGFASGAEREPFDAPKTGQWTLDAKGRPADPVTLYVHGTLEQLEGALVADGWSKADAGTPAADARYAGAAVAQESLKGVADLNKKLDPHIDRLEERLDHGRLPVVVDLADQAPELKAVDRMPVSIQTYNGRPLVAAYERNNDPLGGRDHLRLFDTGQKDASGAPVYAIAASKDSGLRLAPDHPETGFVFHKVQPDVGGERDAVLASLKKQGASVTQELSLGWPGTSVYGEQVVDGKAFELTLP